MIRILPGFLAGLLFAGSGTATFAQRLVDPQSLSPQERANVERGPLYDRDPSGRTARPGCTWSRIQIMTATGLRWVASEDCGDQNKR